jgi:D-glycero-D-manno-heptose 1,7-bisphosphate phosphatase
MTGPVQAAILCGGLGTRLRPLTDSLPKPMAPVNGRPFLLHLVEQLRDQGITRILLLVGYRGEMIQQYFGDGSRWGVHIDYSSGPAEWETGRRIWEARDALDPQFFLLYCDNFASVRLDRVAALHAAGPADVTLVVQPKPKGNIRLAAGGGIELYDPSRTAAGLDHVEIGYMLVERVPVLAALPDPDVGFSRVLESLTTKGRVNGLVSRDTYHSISDYDRWRLTERYLQPKRILMIDRDGTINARPPKAHYVRSWEDFEFLDDSVEAMRQLAAHRFRFIVVSNQAGIARGMQDPAAVEAVNRRMVAELAARGVEVLAVYVCPHHWDEGCDCRKPEPGLFLRASREHLVRLDRTVYIGDDPRDCRAAFNAGCLSVLIGPERSEDPGDGIRPAFASATLLDVVPWTVAQFETWETAVEVA